jgi:hypothetical protein
MDLCTELPRETSKRFQRDLARFQRGWSRSGIDRTSYIYRLVCYNKRRNKDLSTVGRFVQRMVSHRFRCYVLNATKTSFKRVTCITISNRMTRKWRVRWKDSELSTSSITRAAWLLHPMSSFRPSGYMNIYEYDIIPVPFAPPQSQSQCKGKCYIFRWNVYGTNGVVQACIFSKTLVEINHTLARRYRQEYIQVVLLFQSEVVLSCWCLLFCTWNVKCYIKLNKAAFTCTILAIYQ